MGGGGVLGLTMMGDLFLHFFNFFFGEKKDLHGGSILTVFASGGGVGGVFFSSMISTQKLPLIFSLP